jgi:hypothetical protein
MLTCGPKINGCRNCQSIRYSIQMKVCPQMGCLVCGVLYLCCACADLGDDVSDIPGPADAWVCSAVRSELTYI